MSLRKKIENIIHNAQDDYIMTKKHIPSQGIYAMQILDLFQSTIEKAEKWDCAMAQTNYCDDCKAPLLEEEIRRLTYNGSEEKAERRGH